MNIGCGSGRSPSCPAVTSSDTKRRAPRSQTQRQCERTAVSPAMDARAEGRRPVTRAMHRPGETERGARADVCRLVVHQEVIKMVRMALGLPDLAPCHLGDATGDGEITVDEIVKAVGVLLTPENRSQLSKLA